MNATTNARRLRKHMTEAERRLWQHLRLEQIQGCKFRRQTPIGPYIADFVSFDAMLIIEVDGGQHAENREADEHRTRYLNGLGYKVIRFWNNQVLQETAAVLESIRQELVALARPHPASPVGGRDQGAMPQDEATPIPTSSKRHPLPPTGEGRDGGDQK